MKRRRKRPVYLREPERDAIRRAYRRGESSEALAIRYGVSVRTIQNVLAGR